MTELRQAQVANRKRLVRENKPGYTALDWAYYLSSESNLRKTGFSVNWPNQEGNRWQPLGDPPPSGQRWQGPAPAAARAVSRLAKLSGADLVGFCRLDRRWVYSHWFDERTGKDYPIRFSDERGYEGYDRPTELEDGTQVIPKEMEYVVVMIHAMDEEGMAAAPTLTQMATVSLTYSKISFGTVTVAEFIRGLGYNAIPSANCTALNIPLAIDAGFGQLGRHGKLITPQFGPRCRISKVITDLPLPEGSPIDFGVTEFCNACLKCVRKCPAGAISAGEQSYEPVDDCNTGGVLRWQLDGKRCYEYCSRVGTFCGICIRVCPFNKGKGKVHNVTRWFIKHTRWADPIIVRLDDVMGYGRLKNAGGFWGSKTVRSNCEPTG
ncbi:MAG: reductive dehalogenase [Dehalococcoidia bacterium]